MTELTKWQQHNLIEYQKMKAAADRADQDMRAGRLIMTAEGIKSMEKQINLWRKRCESAGVNPDTGKALP